MDLEQATEAILQKFVDDWGSTTPYALPNESSSLAQGSVSWVRLTIQELKSRQLSLGVVGNRRFNRRAMVIWQVFTPMNTGSQASNQYVESLRGFFEGVTVNGLMFHNAETQSHGNDGKWYQVNVTANFEFDEIK